jgi:tRNA(adenine34) deaminase
VHHWAWHRDVLLEWLDRLQPGPLALLHSAAASELVALLAAAAPDRFLIVRAAPEGGEPAAEAWRAPFPDRGYEAALRALGPVRRGASGPTVAQAAALIQDAMGYFAP